MCVGTHHHSNSSLTLTHRRMEALYLQFRVHACVLERIKWRWRASGAAVVEVIPVKKESIKQHLFVYKSTKKPTFFNLTSAMPESAPPLYLKKRPNENRDWNVHGLFGYCPAKTWKTFTSAHQLSNASLVCFCMDSWATRLILLDLI